VSRFGRPPTVIRTMAGVPLALGEALDDRYLVERELGRGGMATVYLAHDRKHDRRVALKVLRRDLSHVLGRERFVQEVRIVARLQHPHIVPLFDSGEAAGQLWYTMPYVEGESLRQRLRREGPLALDECVRISEHVLAALAYAHQHGIIHRDLKPENILLESGEAVVADFGIAHAVDAAGGEQLTESGLVLGTPTYMSPEQASSREQVDARSDIYSFGCVLYEMVAGEPPFPGPSPLAVLARHAMDPVPTVHDLQPAVPTVLEQAITKALAKSPADRFASAAEFSAALSKSLHPSMGIPRLWPPPSPRLLGQTARKRLVTSLAAVTLLLIGAAVTLPRWRGSSGVALDRKVVAVVPFRVTGADSSLRYLREGMLDLLTTKLNGTRDLRTVDPRTLLRAWKQAGGKADADLDLNRALRLAGDVGAGRVLEGEVIGNPQHLVLNAKISDAQDRGEVRASVEGPTDSLTVLVDRLAAQLLALGAGVERHRLAALTTTSLPALRAYLDGRVALRQGDYATARDHFDRAIELDSSFALAGLGRTSAAGWLGEGAEGPGSRLAWRYRDRLSTRDLAVLRQMLGRRYPLRTSQRENLADAEALVEAAPDSPEAWSTLGDFTFHYGWLVGLTDPLQRSVQAYRRALALDSSYSPALEHLPELYYLVGDLPAARQGVVLNLKLDSVTPNAAVARWFARSFLNDSVLGNISLGDDSLVVNFAEVIRLAVHHGGARADAESLLTLYRRRISTAGERGEFEDFARRFYLNLGQPSRALAATDHDVMPPSRIILDALYADGDSAAAAAAASLPRRFTRPTVQTPRDRVVEQYAVAQYDLAHGKPKAARAAVLAWRDTWAAQDTADVIVYASCQAVSLDAQLAARDRRPDALLRLTELDSLLQEAPTYGEFFEPLGNIVAARLWHERGDDARALASIRRRVIGLGRLRPTFATYLRDEGRYAALAGDREGAIKAYRHYLALRSDAEPHLQPQVDAVRAELAALERETTDR
jgi:tRNA A-37 threonylcarbamoyl transferase component Bud32/tetratricopeptide (TPR) repeat protein